MASCGSQRRRRYVNPDEVPNWVPGGRWGPRRARVEQCLALRAELVCHQALCEGEPLQPGSRLTLIWRPSESDSWEIEAEPISNAVWRNGRLFLRCPGCGLRATRLYVPLRGLEPRCRRCWGLSCASRSWSYKAVGWFAFLGPIAYATTEERRRRRREALGSELNVARLLLTSKGVHRTCVGGAACRYPARAQCHNQQQPCCAPQRDRVR